MNNQEFEASRRKTVKCKLYGNNIPFQNENM